MIYHYVLPVPWRYGEDRSGEVDCGLEGVLVNSRILNYRFVLLSAGYSVAYAIIAFKDSYY